MARRVFRTLASTLVLALLTGMLLASGAAPAAANIRPGAEVLMVHQINQTRAAHGLPRLVSNLQMKRIARQWSTAMANRGRVFHRSNLAAVVDGNYQRLAENVGYTRLEGAYDSTLVSRLHRGFLQSDGHRAHILGRFNMVGVGIERRSNGRMYVTVNFLLGPLDGFPLYRDADGRASERAIGSLFARAAVYGCDSNRFCPVATAPRRYVATVLNRATRTRLATRWLAARCGTSLSCRTGAITKVELADMITSVLRLDPLYRSTYTDITRSDAGAVYAVVRAGIMGGCTASRFCPGSAVSRERAAAIVYRAAR